jgi:hypothetical protein
MSTASSAPQQLRAVAGWHRYMICWNAGRRKLQKAEKVVELGEAKDKWKAELCNIQVTSWLGDKAARRRNLTECQARWQLSAICQGHSGSADPPSPGVPRNIFCGFLYPVIADLRHSRSAGCSGGPLSPLNNSLPKHFSNTKYQATVFCNWIYHKVRKRFQTPSGQTWMKD